MQLNLKNPILFFDLETTGLNVASDRIVELSAIKIMPNGKEEIKTRRLNPTIPISAEAMAIHRITNEDVADCPTFKEIAKSLAQWIEGCDLAGYNSIKFDIPILAEEFLRAGIHVDFRKRKIIDVQNIFHKMEQRTLIAAYKFYCNKDLNDAHSAEADALATYEVLKSQLDRYSELKNDVAFLAEFSSKNRNLDYAGRIILNEQDEPVVNFGKHKGRKVRDVFRDEPSYYAWIMDGDFTLDTKRVLTEFKLSLQSQGA
ncbi:MAG: 3'-5' exonuclease [Bacteroidales bacterium]|nr:3'-5' exonuclease [Bacteroidales bacterium]MCL2738820.1 3'-5' exonuclease [Bacteroidales bacterium]